METIGMRSPVARRRFSPPDLMLGLRLWHPVEKHETKHRCCWHGRHASSGQ